MEDENDEVLVNEESYKFILKIKGSRWETIASLL